MPPLAAPPPPADGSPPTGARRFWSSRPGRWLLLTFFWLVLAALSAAQLPMRPDMEWRTAFAFALIDWGPWIVLSPLVLWFAGRFHIDAGNWRRTVPIHAFGALVTAVIVQLMTDALVMGPLLPPPEMEPRRLPPDGEWGPPPRDFWERGPKRDRPPPDFPKGGPGRGGRPRGGGPERYLRARFALPIYCVLVAGAHALFYHRRSLERERRALAAEARLTEARLMALQNQLNPHFLFNTLNAISSLVYAQPAVADEMICALSDLLRRVLATSERREVTLAEELELVDRYLALQRIRFADRLEIRREIAPGLERVAVPTFILQPLVENAIIHGIAPRTTCGTITLQAEAVGDCVRLSICDTGAGAPPPPRRPDGTIEVVERIGLRNTRARLASLHGDDARFSLEPGPDGGWCARLELPLRSLPAT